VVQPCARWFRGGLHLDHHGYGRIVKAIPTRWIGDGTLRSNVAFVRAVTDARQVVRELAARRRDRGGQGSRRSDPVGDAAGPGAQPNTSSRPRCGRPRRLAARLDIDSDERKLGVHPSRSKEVVVVSVALEPDRDTRDAETQALEEIRQLFARYRQIARHGAVVERQEPAGARAEEPNGAPVAPER
jgi:hypothetical protein